MNELTREQRVELYERARELSETTGEPLEYCMVKLQRLEQTRAEYQAILKAHVEAWRELMTAVTPILQEWSASMIDAFKEFQALWDRLEEQPAQPLCPHHRIAMRGGRCPRCDRSRR